jgi:hypothetical protein
MYRCYWDRTVIRHTEEVRWKKQSRKLSLWEMRERSHRNLGEKLPME